MSTDKMRSKFEAWYCKEFAFANMARNSKGEYRGEQAYFSWVAYQAALSQSEPAQVSQAPVDGYLHSDGSESPVCGIPGESEMTFQHEDKRKVYLVPPDYEALKENTKLLDGILRKVIEERNNAEQNMHELKCQNIGLLSEYPKQINNLIEERNILKLRVAELEAATEHLGLTPQQAKDGLSRHKALAAERDRLQSDLEKQYEQANADNLSLCEANDKLAILQSECDRFSKSIEGFDKDLLGKLFNSVIGEDYMGIDWEESTIRTLKKQLGL